MEVSLQSLIMDNLPEGVVLIRASDQAIVYASAKFEEMFGYGPGELLNKPISIINAPTEETPQEKAEEIIDSLRKNNVWRGEIKNVKKDGTQFWCEASVATFEHPQFGQTWLSIHTDITERKKAEQELIKTTEELRDSMEALGKMNKLMVGRELKMIELKREVERLKRKYEH